MDLNKQRERERRQGLRWRRIGQGKTKRESREWRIQILFVSQALPGTDTSHHLLPQVTYGLLDRNRRLLALHCRKHIGAVQPPLPHRANHILTANEPGQEDPPGCQGGDGATDGVVNGLRDELPTDQREVRVVLLEELLEGVLVGLLDEDVDLAMGVELVEAGDSDIDTTFFDLTVDCQLLAESVHTVGSDFLDAHRHAHLLLNRQEHAVVVFNSHAGQRTEALLDRVPDDDGLVDYVHLLALVRFTGDGFGHDRLLIVDVEQVFPVLLFETADGRVTVPLQNVGLGGFKVLRRTVHTEQVVIGPHVLHLLLARSQDDALADIVGVLLEEGLLLLQLQRTTLRKIRVAVLGDRDLTVTAAAESQQGLGSVFLSQTGTAKLEVQSVPQAVFKTISQALLDLAPATTSKETRSLQRTKF